MPDINQVIQDKGFYDLPVGERQKVLQKIDPNYAGLPNAEQLKVLNQLSQNFSKPVEPVQPKEEPTRLGIKPASYYEDMAGGEKLPPALGTFQASDPAVRRMGLEGGAMAVGSVAGGVPGGALGYAIGKKTADIIDVELGQAEPRTMEQEAIQTVKDVATGAALEAGGQLATQVIFRPLFKGGKWVFDKTKDVVKSAFTKKGAEESAGQVLKAFTSAGPIYAKNAEEALKIEKQIPGLKFTIGQRTNDPNLIKLERSQVRGPASQAATDQNAEQIASNNEALRSYYQKNFGGKGDIDDLIANLKGKQEGLAAEGATAGQRASQELLSLPQQEPSGTGQKLVETLGAGKSVAEAQASKLYEAVPKTTINISTMLDDFKAIAKPLSKFEDPSNIPDLIGTVRKAFPKGEAKSLSIDDLQGLRSEFLEQARNARSAINPNRRLAARYDKAARAVDDALTAAENKDATGALRGANAFFRENVAKTYRQGTVGDILQSGARGETTKIPLAKIPGKIWGDRSLAAADDLLKAAPEEAPAIMKEYAGYDLYRSVTDESGNIVSNKLNSWLVKNRPLLKKFGLEGQFKNIAAAQKAADAAKTASIEFEKTAAGRILGSDPERAIAKAFSGKNPKQAAEELYQMVKGDKAALNGLQNSYADHVMNKIQTTAKDIAGNTTISNAKFQTIMKDAWPAMKVIYKSSPEKLKALMNMRKAYEIAVRNQRSPIGGGSDTAENLMSELSKVNILYRPATILRGMISVVERHGKQRANEFVTRAMFDPDYAKTLLNMASGKVTGKQLIAEIDGKIIQLDAIREARAAAASGAAALTSGKAVGGLLDGQPD